MGRVGRCVLCACDNEEREHGVGTGVNDTMMSETITVISLVQSVCTGLNAIILSETLSVMSLAESAVREFRLRKKPMNLCACDSEDLRCEPC